PLEGGEDLVAGQRAAELEPALELVEQLDDRLVCAKVERGPLADRRRLEAVSPSQHRAHESAHRRERLGGLTEGVERAQRLAAQLQGLLYDALRVADPAAAQPALEVVDVRAREARER